MIYLPEMIDKIKDTIEGLKGNWQDYEVHKAATPESENVHGLQGVIQTLTALFGAEYGKNENGNWIRFNFGWQMCWCTMTLLYGSSNRLVATWTFPKPFKDTNYAVSHAIHGNMSSSVPMASVGTNMYYNITNNSIQVNVYRVTGTANFAQGDTGVVKAQAIGWWKAPENPAEWSEE